MRIILLAGTVLAMAGTAATAQESQAFNGAFVGVQGGWQQDRQTLDVRGPGANLSATEKGDGFLYGGQIGYDFRLGGPAVLGLEVGLAGRTGSQTLDDGFSTFRLTQGRTFNTTARLGVLTDPQGLAYVRGGYANARFRIDDAGTRFAENRDGWTIGAGYERMMATNVSARVEYNYSDFGRDRLPTIAIPGTSADLKYRRHAITAGANFRF